MSQIKIGTCVPEKNAMQVINGLVNRGFESIEFIFDMDFRSMCMEKLADAVVDTLSKNGMTISSLGFYCNALINKEDVAGLEKVITLAQHFALQKYCCRATCFPAKTLGLRNAKHFLPTKKDCRCSLVLLAGKRGFRPNYY